MKTRVFLTLSLFLTTLQAIRLGLTKKVISDADKKDILNVNDDDAFSKYLQMYDDIEPAILRVSSSPTVMKQVRAKQKKTFVANLKRIKKHNKKYKRGKSKYDMSINSFTMMDKENRKMFHGLNISHISNKYKMKNSVKFTVGAVGSIPSSLDWKQRGWMTGVKNQGGCGSCWTFPTTALVEFAYKASTGKMVQLSEQQMLDCTYDAIEPGYDGCEGGFYTEAWNWIIEINHLAKMGDYTYKGRDGRCISHYYSSAIKDVLKVKGYKAVGKSENEAIQAMQIMPLAVAFLAEDAFFSVGEGIYDGCRGIDGSINHAVTLTAYSGQYWEIKNSWGADWARKGYGRLQRGRGSICNLLNHVYYIQYEDLDKSDGQDPDDTDPTDDTTDDTDPTDEDDLTVVLKSASTSSDYLQTDAFNAIDKDKDSFCHTDYEAKPWLQITFENKVAVDKVLVYNMENQCCYHRLNGATVTILNDGEWVGSCGTIYTGSTLTKEQQTYEISCNGMLGNGLKLQLEQTSMLHVYEVEVVKMYGESAPTEPPTKPDDEKCEDKDAQCKSWQELYNYCTDGEFTAWMTDNCAASCKHCTRIPCKDFNINCPGWANDFNYCTTGEFVGYMQDKCAESCGLCASSERKYVASTRVLQSSTYTDWEGIRKSAERAVDGSMETTSHTSCGDRPWFRYYLPANTVVGQVVLVNGKLNHNRVRLDGATVMATNTDTGLFKTCGVITVTNSATIEGQTYVVECADYLANYISVSLQNRDCLELRDIKVYAKTEQQETS